MNTNFKNPMVKWWVNVIVTAILIICACVWSGALQTVRTRSPLEGIVWAIWTFDFLVLCWIIALLWSLFGPRRAKKAVEQ